MDDRHRLVAMLRAHAVRRGRFTLASGATSDLYVDAREVTLRAEGAALVGRLVASRLRPEVRGVGGLALGAVPIAVAAAIATADREAPVHAFVVRKSPKGHGTGRRIEGRAPLPPGTPVCVVEDTTTTGASLLRAARVAAEEGLEVVQLLTLVDREEGAAERVAEAGWRLEALVRREELVEAHP